MLHKRLVAGDLPTGDRAPNTQRRVDARGETRREAFSGFRLNTAPTFLEDDTVSLADIGIVHVERDIPSRPCLLAIQGRHLPGEHQARVFLFARFANPPAGIRHRLEDITREQVPIKLIAGLPRYFAGSELLPGLPNPGKVLVCAIRQLLHPEQLALPAEDRRVAALPAKPIEQAGHAIIVALCRIETAGRDHHRALAAHIVAGRMPAAFRFRAHKGQRHGKLAVDQVLQLAGQPEVIQGEAPDDDVGP